MSTHAPSHPRQPAATEPTPTVTSPANALIDGFSAEFSENIYGRFGGYEYDDFGTDMCWVTEGDIEGFLEDHVSWNLSLDWVQETAATHTPPAGISVAHGDTIATRLDTIKNALTAVTTDPEKDTISIRQTRGDAPLLVMGPCGTVAIGEHELLSLPFTPEQADHFPHYDIAVDGQSIAVPEYKAEYRSGLATILTALATNDDAPTPVSHVGLENLTMRERTNSHARKTAHVFETAEGTTVYVPGVACNEVHTLTPSVTDLPAFDAQSDGTVTEGQRSPPSQDTIQTAIPEDAVICGFNQYNEDVEGKNETRKAPTVEAGVIETIEELPFHDAVYVNYCTIDIKRYRPQNNWW